MSDSQDDLKAFLAQTQLWQGLSSDCIDFVAKLAVPQTYDKGRLIFSEGESGRGFFIIRSGRVKVFKVSSEGKEQILRVFGAGEHFAEVAALDGQCFPASAAALESTAVLFFSRETFVDFLQHHPTLAINVLASFARRLRQFTQLIEALSLKAVPSRLAAYLLALSEQANHADIVELDLTKGQLAAVIGTIPETLSRVFLKLSQEGLIKLNGSQITVLDRQQLKHLSRGGKISEKKSHQAQVRSTLSEVDAATRTLIIVLNLDKLAIREVRAGSMGEACYLCRHDSQSSVLMCNLPRNLYTRGERTTPIARTKTKPLKRA